MKQGNIQFSPGERAALNKLSTPSKIQAFLDSIPYSAESIYRSPRSVLRDRKAHCFDGAMFAAAALRRIGYPPLIMDMQAVRDDDHVVAIFRQRNCWGAVAKSNFTGIRFREPVYRTRRELVMSYFDMFFNMHKEKTLRQFTVPLNLARYDSLDWMTNDAAMDVIGEKLAEIEVTKILSPVQIRALNRVDDRLFNAGMLGVDMKGVYMPE
jgi:hypothetical protein